VDIRRRDLIEDHRTLLPGHASGETLSDWDPHPLVDLLVDATCGRGDEVVPARRTQQHDGGVDREKHAHPAEKLVEQVLDIQVSQVRVRDGLDTLQALRELPRTWLVA
jgi:hypothetical protein